MPEDMERSFEEETESDFILAQAGQVLFERGGLRGRITPLTDNFFYFLFLRIGVDVESVCIVSFPPFPEQGLPEPGESGLGDIEQTEARNALLICVMQLKVQVMVCSSLILYS